MGRIRTSKLSEIAFALLALGACGGGASIETTTESVKVPRRPDGVVVDPPPAIPSAQERAPAAGVVALREPPLDKDVEEVVRAYFRGFEREDREALAALLTQDATPLGRAGSRQQLIDIFTVKMRSYEYQKLAGTQIARIAQIEKRTYDSFAAPGAPSRPPTMRAGDLYVRVPVILPRVGGEQLFGDVVVFLLRREDGRLKIAGEADETGN